MHSVRKLTFLAQAPTVRESTDMTEVAAKPKKAKWRSNVISIVIMLWFLGGVEVFLLRDIPLLVVFGAAVVLISLPVARWLGKPESRWIAPVWGGTVIVAIIALLLFVIPPFSISRQTTYLTEPRSTEFYGIDYLTAIEKRIKPNVPPEDNGFRLLLQKFGRPFLADYTDENWNYICTKLSVPAVIEPSVTFVDWNIFTKNLPEEERKIVEENCCCEDVLPPFSEKQLPLVKRWLDENNTAIEIFTEAMQKPVLYAPTTQETTLMDSGLVLEPVMRNMARSLQVRCRYRLATGDVTGAWDDVRLIYRIVELHRPLIWNIITLFVHNAVRGVADKSAESVLFYGNKNVADIQKMLAEVVSFQKPITDSDIKNVILGERFTALDSLQALCNGNIEFAGLAGSKPITKSNIKKRLEIKWSMSIFRLGRVMKDLNVYYDERSEKSMEFVDDKFEPSQISLVRLFKMFIWYGQPKCVTVLISNIFRDLMGLPNYPDAIRRSEADASLTRLLFVLELYRREHDEKYPESLDELHSGYIDEIPLDPFSKQPFLCVLDDDRRGYLIYSVGANGIDENGRNNNDIPKGDDVRRRIRLTVY
ncbi:hypothetical protein FACS18942_03530 [Planctomycetales bacterium]|nr:hypothetical protein FACS18942_03530 [Planctomycetales bacterium]